MPFDIIENYTMEDIDFNIEYYPVILEKYKEFISILSNKKYNLKVGDIQSLFKSMDSSINNNGLKRLIKEIYYSDKSYSDFCVAYFVLYPESTYGEDICADYMNDDESVSVYRNIILNLAN